MSDGFDPVAIGQLYSLQFLMNSVGIGNFRGKPAQRGADGTNARFSLACGRAGIVLVVHVGHPVATVMMLG